MTQLREIGNAFNLYASENKGWWPVVQHRANGTQPSNRPDYRTSGPERNDYWYMFLLKYFSKKAYVNQTGKRLGDFQNTPLWGCPALTKEDLNPSASSADFNSGYGMSVYAGYTETRYLGLNAGPNVATWGVPVAGGHWPMIQLDTLRGRYYKQTEWTKPALRGLITDSRSWYNETRNVASEAAIVDPTGVGPVGYDGAASHQFDKWRHGAKRGGRNPVNFNILFCDGHVAAATSIVDGFKAMRMKFPG